MKIYLGLLFLFWVCSLAAQNSLTINVSNIQKIKGNLEIAIFNSDKNFLKKGSNYQKKSVKITGKRMSYTFANLPAGFYAVSVYHDENSNQTFDVNFLGLPVEDFGFSKNFKPKLSAPKFEQVKEWVEDKKTITIELIPR